MDLFVTQRFVCELWDLHYYEEISWNDVGRLSSIQFRMFQHSLYIVVYIVYDILVIIL